MGSHPARLPKECYVGCQRLFLTLCTHNRQRFFLDRLTVQAVTLTLLQSGKSREFELTAYCFMPDHLHALLTTNSETADSHVLVKLIKQRTGYWFSRVNRRRLWQRGFFDRTLRATEDSFQVIRYIVENPVRAGLVPSPDDYPFWGSQTYTRQEILEFVRDRPT